MLAVILSVLLGVLLLSAAALKFTQPSCLTAQAAVALGLPKALAAGWRARCAVVLLVGLEAGLAVGLQVPGAVRVAAAGAFTFFVATAVLLAGAVRRGSTVPCGCFGVAAAPRPVGQGSVLRNIVAATMSLLVATRVAAPRDLSIAASWAVAMATIAGAFAAAFFILAWRSRASGAAARPSLESGLHPSQSTDWAWQLPMSDGTAVQGELLKQVGRLLIVFSDPSCAPCRAVQAALASYSWPRPDGTGLLVISRGGLDMNVRMADELSLPAVALQQDFEIATLFNVDGTPGGVVVENGVVVGGPAAGSAAMSRLVADVTRVAIHRSSEGDPKAGVQPVDREEPDSLLRTLGKVTVGSRENANEI